MRTKLLMRIGFIFVFILFSSCMIEKAVDLISDEKELKAPEWDLDYEVPLFEKTIKMADYVNLNDYLSKLQYTNEETIGKSQSGLLYMALDPITINKNMLGTDEKVERILGGSPLTWPLPLKIYRTPTVIENSFPRIELDLDSDGSTDLALARLQSEDGFLLISVGLTITEADGTSRSIERGDYFCEDGKTPLFGISQMKISDKIFEFYDGYYDETSKKLKIKTKNFLTDKEVPLTPVLRNPDDPNCSEYVFKFELPKNTFYIRGNGFEFIDNLLEEQSGDSRGMSCRSRCSRSSWSQAEIQTWLANSGGGINALEDLVENQGVSVGEIAAAYQNDGDGIDDLLSDVGGVSILDVLSSEPISQNTEELAALVGNYDLGGGVSISDINGAGNLAGLSDFCQYYKTHKVGTLSFSFSVEVNLGTSFIIVGEFVHDFKAISLKQNKNAISLPLSNIGKYLNDIKIHADIDNSFSFPVNIDAARVKDCSSGKETAMLFDNVPETCVLRGDVREMREIKFARPFSEMKDSDLLMDVIIPKGSACTIGLSTDFFLTMKLIISGNAWISPESW